MTKLELFRGLIRGLIALIMWAGIILLLLLNRPVPGEIWIAAGMITAFYFGENSNNGGSA